jgi:hypothetical protein
MKYLLSLDPGGTTGWEISSYTDTNAIVPHDGGQIPNGVDGFVEWMLSDEMWKLPMMDSHNEGVTVVSESFQLRPGVKNPDVTPLRIEGALTALLGPGAVTYQQPATKALVPDQKLRDVGLWIPGQRHRMDARIHALAWGARNKHLPTLQLYWPEKD